MTATTDAEMRVVMLKRPKIGDVVAVQTYGGRIGTAVCIDSGIRTEYVIWIDENRWVTVSISLEQQSRAKEGGPE